MKSALGMKATFGRSWMIAAAAVLALSTASCASEPSVDNSQVEVPSAEVTTDETGPDATDTAGTDQVEHDVTSEELEGELVGSFPADVPLYDGRIDSSGSGVGEVTENPEWNVMVVTEDSLDTVDASLRESYSENGWAIANDMEFAGGYHLTARSAGYTVSITYNDFGGPEVMITYGVSARG